MSKKISIVVPIYNTSKYLDKCVQSLINQSYKDIEIILVNDGSTDDSLEICKQYKLKDNRIKIIDINNAGVSNARNIGIEYSSGDFIMFCDSDDYVSSKWCENLILNYREENLVMCSYYEVQDTSILNLNDNKKGNCTINKSKFMKLESCGLNVPWNKIFDLNIIKRNNIKFNKNITLGEDLLFNIEYLDYISGEIIFLDEKLYYYRLPRVNSLSKKIIKNYDEQCIFLFKKIQYYIQKFNMTDKDLLKRFYDMMFFQFQKALEYNFLDENYTLKDKFKRNNKIMKTYEYRQCCLNSSISTNKVYRWCYRKYNYYFIYLLNLILKKI